MFSQGPGTIAELVAKCLQAREMAYCSYSGFPVGAAVLTTGGAIIGCNVENASWPYCMCGENCDTESESFHLTNSDIKDSFVGPCGACRQVLMEFGTEWDIYLTKPDGIIGRPVSESSCL
uniref:Zgc:103586 n=1 Tax=Sinocyclocheilus rhinocerous TaxID=307959 RepID=A0A673MDT7_9TELE